jgi:hypothetical protein
VRLKRRLRVKIGANVRQRDSRRLVPPRIPNLPRQRLRRRQVRSHSSPWSHEDHTHLDRVRDEIYRQAELDEASGQQYHSIPRTSPLHVLRGVPGSEGCYGPVSIDLYYTTGSVSSSSFRRKIADLSQMRDPSWIYSIGSGRDEQNG